MKYNSLTTIYKDHEIAKQTFEFDQKICGQKYTGWKRISKDLIAQSETSCKIIDSKDFVEENYYLRVGPDWANEISQFEVNDVLGAGNTSFEIKSCPGLKIVKLNEGYPVKWSINIFYNGLIIWKNGFWITKDQNIKNLTLLYFTSIRENRNLNNPSYCNESCPQNKIEQVDLNKVKTTIKEVNILPVEKTPTEQVLATCRKKMNFLFNNFNEFSPYQILEHFDLLFRDLEIAYALEKNDHDSILKILTCNNFIKTEPI